MNRLFFLLCMPLLLFFSCKKEDGPATALPPVTQEGSNTVGFLLDGQVWVPFGKCGLMVDPCQEISASYGLPMTDEEHISFQIARENKGKSSALTITGHTKKEE